MREAVNPRSLGLALYLGDFPEEFVLDVAADLLYLQNTYIHYPVSQAPTSQRTT